MIDTIRPVGANVCGRYAQVLQEGGVVGTAAEIADANIVLDGGCRFCWSTRGLRLRRLGTLLLLLRGSGFPLIVYAATFRTGHGLGHVAQVLLQTWHRRSAEVGAGNGHVHVEVGDGPAEFLGVLLGELGRAYQAFLLRIPTGKNDGALRVPSGLEQLSRSEERRVGK